MAVRSGAGTGVVVALVVFVLTTVFLLILTIVFYAGKADATDRLAQAQDDLETYVKPQQQSSDQFKGFEQAASANGQSVAGYLNSQYESLLGYLNGDATVSMEQLRADLTRYDVPEDGVVKHVLEESRRDLRSSQVENDGLKGKLADREAELAEKQSQIDRMKEDHRDELEQVSREIVTYREAAGQYRDELRQTIADMNSSVDRLRDQYEARITELEDELDGGNQEIVLLRSRVNEYEALLNDIRIKGKDPGMLVDGRVIDVEPANEQVFIDRGRRDRVVLGMTFEVYDDPASIRPDSRGVLPRGKASVQVVKVDETTSTCKVTRSVPGRPVVRNNVIANAIYDPKYMFKFLVHGKFDVDGDNNPSEAEAEYLRSLVIDWGGEVVIGDELPGDLDFLVLGEMPRRPPPLRPDASDAQTRIYMRQRAARLKYEELFARASEAQIPVLNANRFFILIGHTDR
jgi:multidrug resistance efflux pump